MPFHRLSDARQPNADRRRSSDRRHMAEEPFSSDNTASKRGIDRTLAIGVARTDLQFSGRSRRRNSQVSITAIRMVLRAGSNIKWAATDDRNRPVGDVCERPERNCRSSRTAQVTVCSESFAASACHFSRFKSNADATDTMLMPRTQMPAGTDYCQTPYNCDDRIT